VTNPTDGYPEQPSNGGSRPVPDPTVLTDAAIAKAVVLLTQYIDGKVSKIETRLDGSDLATDLRLRTIDNVPDLIGKDVSHLELLHDEKFRSVDQRFVERDIRAEREARDNKVAVDAAFAAQKEAASKTDDSNQKAIDKSEAATAEKITKLNELFSTTIDGLGDKIDDVKDRINRIESAASGRIEQRTEHTQDRSATYATIGLIITSIIAAIAIIGFIVAEAGRATT
jgi:hypothetical protein